MAKGSSLAPLGLSYGMTVALVEKAFGAPRKGDAGVNSGGWG